MKDFAGPNDDRKDDELERVPEFMRGSAYLDMRQQQILQSEQAMIGIQRNIRNVTIDIARLLAAAPSAGNQAMLERSFGELNGLANVAAQTATAAPSGSDIRIGRGADVDLGGTRAAIETHANSSSSSALQDGRDNRQQKAEKLKELSTPDSTEASGTDRSTHEDTKPVGDMPTSNLDRVSKLASEASRTSDDPVEPTPSDPSLLPDKRGPRSRLAALKLDHAEVAVKTEMSERQPAQGIEPTARAAPTPAKAELTTAAVRKPPSPGGM